MVRASGYLLTGVIAIILCSGMASIPGASAATVIDDVSNGFGPYVDKIVYNVIEQDDQQILALQDDDIDLIGSRVDPSYFDELVAAEDIEVATALRNGYGYVTINTAKYPYNLTAFRRALAFALDKQAISEEVFENHSVSQDSCVPQANPFSIEGQLPYTYYEPNVVLGNQLLNDAGFTIDPVSGFRRAPDGSPFDVLIECAASSSIAIEVSETVAYALTALSIEATSIPTDFYEYINRLNFHGDYDIAFLATNFNDFDVDWLAYEYWSEYADEPYHNFPNFQNASYDAWRNQLLNATEYNDVYEAAIEMQRILVHACPLIVCYENLYLSAYRTDKFEEFVNDAIDGVPGWWTNQKVNLLDAQGGPFGGTLRWSNSLDIDTFNILVTSSTYSMNVLQELYEPLIRRGPQGDWMNWLAESYVIETDADNPAVPTNHTRITFNIVKNATWSDGVPLSAQDVAFTMNFMRDGPGVAPNGMDLTELYAAYAPQDYVFIAEFSTESYWHLSKMADIPILPKHQWAPIGADNWNLFNPTFDELITSGPFYISDYVAGNFTELTRNPLYFMTPPDYDGDIGMGYPPSVSPTINPQLDDADSLEQEFEAIWDAWSEPTFSPEIGPLLEKWVETGELDQSIVSVQGDPRVIAYLAPWVGYSEFDGIIEIDWKMDFRAFKMIQGSIESGDELAELLSVNGITAVFADKMKNPIVDEFDRSIDYLQQTPSESLDMSEFRDLIGSLGPTSSDYTGNGVVVGHIDSGCDFGINDLQAAFNNGTYDATGYGLNLVTSLGNTSYVADVQSWLDAGNVLTYENASGIFLNATGWDPLLNMQGLYRYLIGDGEDGIPYDQRIGFVWFYAYHWGIQVGDFMDQMWKDVKLPDTSEVNGEYHLGYVFQQRGRSGSGIPYAKLFAPALVYESSANNEWNLAIDWDGADAWSLFWNGGFYYESIDLLNSTETQPITDRLDFDFTDDISEETYNMSNPIVAKDLDGDGLVDLSLGALSWCFDQFGLFGDEPMVNGFRSDGNGFCLYFDDGSHGTATAAHVASRGIETYYDANNDTYFTMSGIANESEILSVRAITSGSEIGAYVWACGFDYNESTSEFYYTGNHMADVITNSWGWVVEPSAEMNYISLIWTILSVPSYLDASYPGVLHIFSSGNEGSGFMTVGPPGCSAGVLTVGASTSYSYVDYLYGPGQDVEGIASFSSKGPSFLGYVKPDVVAPGLAAYAPTPLYALYFYENWEEGSYSIRDYENITLFSGTSQSTPVVAGAAALLIEALDTRGVSWTPDKIKTIIQSTSDSLGYDPATQGFGRINANAACDFAENDVGFIVESSGSFDNIMDLLDDYWTYNSDYAGDLLDITMPSGTLPTGFGEGSLYFGVVHAGDSVSLRQNVYGDASGTMLTDLTGWTTSAYYWNESETYSFDGVTHVYNDTAVSGKGAYGWFDIRTAIGAANYDSVIASSNYATICVSFADEDISTYGAPWMFLHDWTDDSPADGIPNLWNSTSEQGDELKRLASANDPSNANMMSYATSLASLNAALNGDLTLVIHDPIFDTDWSAVGHQFTCTVIFWETVSTSIISDNGGLGVSTFDWNLTVPTDDAGIYQGYLDISNGSTTVAVPWSYNLAGNLSGGAGEEHTIVSDFGLELTPYDSPVYGCIEEDPDDYDFRSYAIYNPNAAARYLGIRIVWDNYDSDMLVDLIGPNGTELASSTSSTWNSTAILASISSPYIGNYYLLVRPISLVGRTQLPVNYTINVMWYEEISSPVVYPRYNSNWDSTLYPFTDYDVIEGDHVTLNVTFSEAFLSNFPEMEIQTTILSLNSGILVEQTDNLVIPDGSYDPFSGIVDLTQFAWEVIDGIAEGDTVDIEVDFTNGDCDIMVWWTDTDDTTWTYGNNLVGDMMVTGSRPEYGSFVADRSGNISIGIFDYDLVPGTYTLEVDTIESIVTGSSGRTAIYDTYEIGRNSTFDVEVIGVATEGTEFFAIWDDVTFNNFFSPNVTVVSPNGGETWTSTHSITWTATSLNVEGDPISDVYISNDAGYSYMLFAAGLTGTTLDWDTSIWQDMDSYMVKVKAQDRGMTGEDESDGVFTAGVLPIQGVPPIIFGQLELNYSYGVIGNSLEWIIGDLHPQLIALWVDGLLVSSYSWNTLANVTTVNCDGLFFGSHNYTIYAGDEEGNSATMTTWVHVAGNGLSPVIISPDDILYQVGTTGHEIVWELNDVDPSIYILYLDGAIEDSGAWNGSDITVNVDGLSVGTYNYTLYVEDLDANSTADTVWVEVIDDATPPIIDEPANRTILNGTTNNNITWTVYDQYPTSYWIYQDGVLVDDGTWDSNEIIISIDTLDIGIYDFTLVLTDIGGNFASDTVFVTVVDSSAPEFNLLPDDISFNEGETGFSITWNFTDDNPAQYVLYRNDSMVDSGTWTSPYSYEYAISVTAYGLHNFTIVVNDTTGFSASHTAWVLITDVTPPSLNSPADISFQVGETGYVVDWIPSDNNPLIYSITRNGTVIGSGQWTSGDSLVVDLDGLAQGTFLFTIVVFDQSGNFVMDTVIVEVLEAPTTSSTTTTTTTEPVDVMTIIYIIITIGSIVVIVILVILYKRVRK